MTTFNNELASEVLGQILAYPEQHKQTWWARKSECGTSYCFAGWTCVLAEQLSEDQFYFQRYHLSDRLMAHKYRDDQGTVVLVPERAKELLGLTWAQADDLFSPDHRVADLQRICKDLANDEWQDPNMNEDEEMDDEE